MLQMANRQAWIVSKDHFKTYLFEEQLEELKTAIDLISTSKNCKIHEKNVFQHIIFVIIISYISVCLS